MPSPFPGMDPYVESPALWPSVHYRMPGLIADQLQPQLLPRYVAFAEERVYLEEPRESVGSSLALARNRNTFEQEQEQEQEAGGDTEVAPSASETSDLPLWVEVPELVEAREYFVEIRSLPGHELVTVIELLSPVNKRTAGGGRARYLRKQRQILSGEINLVEIDLLRRGVWTVALPKAKTGPMEPHDYRVCVRRAARPGGFEFYPFRVTQPLPGIRTPLRPDDKDPLLDLGAVFQEAYDRSMVATRIDYATAPDPPLRPEDAAWAGELLRAAGLRRAS